MATSRRDWDDDPSIEERNFSFFKEGLRTLAELTKGFHARIFLGMLFVAIVAVLGMMPFLILRDLLDMLPKIERGFSFDEFTQKAVWLICVMFVYIGFQRSAQIFFLVPTIIDLHMVWAIKAHSKYLELDIGFHDRENTGKKIAKVNKGIEKLTTTIHDIFWCIAPAGITSIIYGVALLVVDPRGAFIFFVPLLAAVWLSVRAHDKHYETWREYEAMHEKAVGMFCQSIVNMRTVQHAVAELREFVAHKELRSKMRTSDIATCRDIELYNLLIGTLYRSGYAIMLVDGVCRVVLGSTSIGTVTFCAMTGTTLINNFWSIMGAYTRMFRNLVAAVNLDALYKEKANVINEAPGSTMTLLNPSLSLCNISHVYSGKEGAAVKNINLTLSPGEMVALVGKSGSGKSTLVSLIARIHDPTGGTVKVNGRNIREVDRDWYRRLFAYVPQSVELFEGTIRHNITYANPNATDADIAEAIEAAALTEAFNDADKFPDGIETEVGERGVKLSGGEQQRVGIARAYLSLLSGAKFLILDEATSSLDTMSERAIQKFLEKMREERDITIIAIAHRLSTIYSSDRICVLERGEIVDIGNHAKLVRQNGLYAKLVELQEMGDVHGDEPRLLN